MKISIIDTVEFSRINTYGVSINDSLTKWLNDISGLYSLLQNQLEYYSQKFTPIMQLTYPIDFKTGYPTIPIHEGDSVNLAVMGAKLAPKLFIVDHQKELVPMTLLDFNMSFQTGSPYGAYRTYDPNSDELVMNDYPQIVELPDDAYLHAIKFSDPSFNQVSDPFTNRFHLLGLNLQKSGNKSDIILHKFSEFMNKYDANARAAAKTVGYSNVRSAIAIRFDIDVKYSEPVQQPLSLLINAPTYAEFPNISNIYDHTPFTLPIVSNMTGPNGFFYARFDLNAVANSGNELAFSNGVQLDMNNNTPSVFRHFINVRRQSEQ